MIAKNLNIGIDENWLNFDNKIIIIELK